MENRPDLKGKIQAQNGDKYDKVAEVALWEKPEGLDNPDYPVLRGVVTLQNGEKQIISLWKVSK